MIKDLNIDIELLQRIDAELAIHYRIMPIRQENDSIEYLVDKTKYYSENIQELEIILGHDVILTPAETVEIDFLLNKYYKRHSISNNNSIKYNDDFLLKIIIEAKNIGSSDIHIECYEDVNRVRMRVDGKLIERYRIEKEDYPVIVNKLKILSNLDISERRLPQDGRINIKNEDYDFDIRVSVLPTLHGEKIVLRILSKDSSNVVLENLGFTSSELRTFREGIKKPNGIILISGPTGSGKTTTLYATLKELNMESSNIVTIEDPIEYTLEGINQVQLKESIGLDFSAALRTFLRQDPDIIMLGEIRDVETANMAIRASLTGHLVLSTIHTNSALATIDRLIDMGIPPFLIAGTLSLSIAQRLVRKLCPHCKQKAPVFETDLPSGFTCEGLENHYKAEGCDSCYHTGYSGRKAIYEIIPVSKDLADNIKANNTELNNYLDKNNIATLKKNAIDLVKKGETSIEEVYSLLI